MSHANDPNSISIQTLDDLRRQLAERDRELAEERSRVSELQAQLRRVEQLQSETSCISASDIGPVLDPRDVARFPLLAVQRVHDVAFRDFPTIIHPFEWDERREDAQATNYLPYLSSLTEIPVYDESEPENVLVLRNTKSKIIRNPRFKAKPDVTLMADVKAILWQTAIGFIELKKGPLTPSNENQALITLLLLITKAYHPWHFILLSNLGSGNILFWRGRNDHDGHFVRAEVTLGQAMAFLTNIRLATFFGLGLGLDPSDNDDGKPGPRGSSHRSQRRSRPTDPPLSLCQKARDDLTEILGPLNVRQGPTDSNETLNEQDYFQVFDYDDPDEDFHQRYHQVMAKVFRAGGFTVDGVPLLSQEEMSPFQPDADSDYE
jgi:hypothetical protein